MQKPHLPLVYYNSLVSNGLYVVVGVVFMSVSVAIIREIHNMQTGGAWLVWLWIFAVGHQLLVFIRKLFDRSPQLILTDTGVVDRTRKVGEILWADISKSAEWSWRGGTFICLEVRDANKYLSRLSPLQSRLAKASVGTTVDVIGLLPFPRRLSQRSKAFLI